MLGLEHDLSLLPGRGSPGTAAPWAAAGEDSADNSQTTAAPAHERRRARALRSVIQLFERAPGGLRAHAGRGQELLGKAETVEASAGRVAPKRPLQVLAMSAAAVQVASEELYALSLLSPLASRAQHETASRRSSSEVRTTTGALTRSRRGKGGKHCNLTTAARTSSQAGLVGAAGLCIDDVKTLYCSNATIAERSHGRPDDRRGGAEAPRHRRRGAAARSCRQRLQQAWLKSLDLGVRVAMHHASSTGLLSARSARDSAGRRSAVHRRRRGNPDLIR